jgi:hypothetical protein
MKRKQQAVEALPLSLEFLSRLRWLDRRPLINTIEPYRQQLFTSALDTVGPDGLPTFNFVLSGRGKKDNKTLDLVLASFYKLLIPATMQGNNGFIVSNDEDQSADDLDLAKKLIAVNPGLKAELSVFQKEIRRKDGRGVLKILPARDVAGLHGKSGNFIGFDEIHGYKNFDLFEALAPDPHRRDVLTWVTSYQGLYTTPGIPIVDFFNAGKAGTDPKMLFSWYSGNYVTDPDFANLPSPEERANPSMASWVDGAKYLEQQKRRLPSAKYRRLHLNEPGAPNGAFFDQGAVLAAVVAGRKSLPPQAGASYVAAVDMSGGTSDNAVLCIAHEKNGIAIVDLIEKQAGAIKPFDPMKAVDQFAARLQEYRCRTVIGDHYGGSSFAFAFDRHGIAYRPVSGSASDQYELLEPRINAGSVEMLDDPTTIEELLTLVVRGTKVTHESGSHDDHANALALAVNAVLRSDDGVSLVFGCLGSSQTSADYYAARDPNEPLITDPLYQRAHDLRQGHITNGQPLPWPEIMARVRAEALLLK